MALALIVRGGGLSMKFSALVHEDIPANRLVCLGGIGSVPDRDPETVYLRLAREGELPDFVATRALTAGETVTVEIKGSPYWTAEAAEDIWAGTLVTTAEGGKVQNFKTSLVQYIGFSTHSAKAGELVTFVRKPGLHWSAFASGGLQVAAAEVEEEGVRG